jgi:hypothetical protein
MLRRRNIWVAALGVLGAAILTAPAVAGDLSAADLA